MKHLKSFFSDLFERISFFFSSAEQKQIRRVLNAIDQYYEDPSLDRLQKVSGQIWTGEKRRAELRTYAEYQQPADDQKKDDRAEIQFVIDEIRKIHPDKGACPSLDSLERNMNSIVLIVRKKDMQWDEQKKMYELRSDKLRNRTFYIEKEKSSVCPDSKYAEQQSAESLGTGFFIQSDVILTAAHVINPPFSPLIIDTHATETSSGADEIRFVTNYKVTAEDAREEKIFITKEDVYRPARGRALLAGQWASLGADWAMIKVEKENGEPIKDTEDRSVVGWKTGVEMGEKVYCLGHGFGLPLKMTMSGQVVRLPNGKDHFDCDLDVFSGNSGSPVFSAEDHRVIGILIRGERNFIFGPHEAHDGKKCLLPSTASGIGEREECQVMDPIGKLLFNKNETKNKKSFV